MPWPFIHPVWMRDAVWGQTMCSVGQRGGAHGMMGGPNRRGQRAEDLQGRLTVSEGHEYPPVVDKPMKCCSKNASVQLTLGWFTQGSLWVLRTLQILQNFALSGT